MTLPKAYPPISAKCPHLLHGGDYNPEQWIRTPDVWDEDMRLMELAHCNAMSVGIFSWSTLEPSEGQFEFGWLDTIMDKMADHGVFAVLAAPSGSKPAWLSRAYPETCRMDADGTRQRHGGRHNHCRTSPVYREKCRTINRQLAERYRDHPALVVWHVNNEYDGEDCHCPLCHAAFREWLRLRYHHDLDRLNEAYWSTFHGHTFPDWDAIEPTDHSIHGLILDWWRFKSDQTIDFFKAESAPLKEVTPDIPVTTNFMTAWRTLDFWAFSKAVDIVSWDSYPEWHETGDDTSLAALTGLLHDFNRTMKGGRPFMMMESATSVPTRRSIKKRKNPGMHLLSSLQAVAHGSDTVQYFQWRKGRGGSEKLHGAVVDHAGHQDTREFREVSEVGEVLTRLDGVVGTSVAAEVAVIQDFENEWAILIGAQVYLGPNTRYRDDCRDHYRPFWEAGVPVDVMDQTGPFENYRLVVAPMAYMLRPGVAERLRDYVAGGGTLVMTYWSAVVNESDLCYLGGVPGAGLRKVFGVCEEESQSYFPGETVEVAMEPGNPLGLEGRFTAVDTCSVIHAEGAEILASYGSDYFSGRPAMTRNRFVKGTAYYLASRNEEACLAEFYGKLIAELGLKRVLDADLPRGVTAQLRTDGTRDFVFLMNFNDKPAQVDLDATYTDALTGKKAGDTVTLGRYGVMVLSRPGYS